MNSTEKILHNFKYHAPKGNQPQMYEDIRDTARDFALRIDTLCPESRERDISLEKLEECVMWANAAIARNTQ